jgi:predicted ABC-class ATPase
LNSSKELDTILIKIDGRGYKAYKELQDRSFNFDNYILEINHVQGDPFASPSNITIRVSRDKARFPDWILDNKIRKIAIEDYLTRIIKNLINREVKGNRGTGKSGYISISYTGQEVIERTSVEFNREIIEARLKLGLPARGRKVLGKQAYEMFFKELPHIVEDSLFYEKLISKELEKHIYTIEDQYILRNKLMGKDLLAFIANDSILPRRSGIDDRPLKGKMVVPFKSPKEFEVEFELPHRGKIKGMGIKKGTNLIVGGGYHGKSTLINALERSVYNHIPGDGREYVVCREDAVKIRAEDGRRVEKVDISPFINNLPQDINTKEFSTENASGSTSQAANIMEALELGTSLLLIDEDTCATNFMIRDARMQKLVPSEKEPITPFIDKVQALYRDKGVSSIIVLGGTGDYFDIADNIIMIDNYIPEEVTGPAKDIAEKYPANRIVNNTEVFGNIPLRYPDPASINPKKANRVKVKARGKNTIQFGYENIELNYVEQLLNQEQNKTIGDILVYLIKKNIINGERSIREVIEIIYSKVHKYGLKIISPYTYTDGDYVLPRPYELSAAINRLRTLKIKKIEYQ